MFRRGTNEPELLLAIFAAAAVVGLGITIYHFARRKPARGFGYLVISAFLAARAYWIGSAIEQFRPMYVRNGWIIGAAMVAGGALVGVAVLIRDVKQRRAKPTEPPAKPPDRKESDLSDWGEPL